MDDLKAERKGNRMETKETIVTVTVHRYRRVRSKPAQRWADLRRWLARLNGWTVAWYALLTVAGFLLYKAGAAYALRERGYYAIGGEALALLLPVLWYVMYTTIRDIVRDVKGRR